MVTKENLLGMLEKCVENEDEFIIHYGSEFLEEIRHATLLDDNDKKTIIDILSVMLLDTKRHKQVVLSLRERIQGDRRNEF